MVHVPVGVAAGTDWSTPGPVCQFGAMLFALLPGAVKRISKYVCAVKLEPEIVERYVDPRCEAGVSKVIPVTVNGRVEAIVPFERIFPLLARSTMPPIAGSPIRFPVQVAFPAASLHATVSLPTVDVTTSAVGASVSPCRLAKTLIVRPF